MADTPPPAPQQPAPPQPEQEQSEQQREENTEETETEQPTPSPRYEPDVQNLINAAKALCENNTLPLEKKELTQ